MSPPPSPRDGDSVAMMVMVASILLEESIAKTTEHTFFLLVSLALSPSRDFRLGHSFGISLYWVVQHFVALSAHFGPPPREREYTRRRKERRK